MNVCVKIFVQQNNYWVILGELQCIQTYSEY
jgi:hypothetical protein